MSVDPGAEPPYIIRRNVKNENTKSQDKAIVVCAVTIDGADADARYQCSGVCDGQHV